MLSRPRTLPAGFAPPCLPMKAPKPPSGALWLHEIKHDGFRVIARKDGQRVKLYSCPGNDLTDRFSLIVEALAGLRSRSCIICGLNVIGRPYVLDLKSEAKTTGCLLHRFHLYRSNWVGWWIKVTGLPLMYWNYMLKGHVWFPKHNTAFKGDVV